MYFSARGIVSIYAALFFSGAALTSAAPANCFQQSRDTYTKPAPGTVRVSAGVVCPDSAKKPCSLSTGGYVNVASTLNITTGAVAPILAAVGKAVNKKLSESVYGSVTNQTYSVEPGRTGYYGFTVTYRCYAGVLADCDTNFDVPSGTAVEVCQPGTLDGKTSDGIPILEGTGAFVVTDRETIANMTTNPAAETKPNASSSGSQIEGLGFGTALLLAISMVLGLDSWLLM